MNAFSASIHKIKSAVALKLSCGIWLFCFKRVFKGKLLKLIINRFSFTFVRIFVLIRLFTYKDIDFIRYLLLFMFSLCFRFLSLFLSVLDFPTKMIILKLTKRTTTLLLSFVICNSLIQCLFGKEDGQLKGLFFTIEMVLEITFVFRRLRSSHTRSGRIVQFHRTEIVWKVWWVLKEIIRLI